jgi:hypothetical protein
MSHSCSNCDTLFTSSGERAKQLPVPSSHESFLLRGLQSGGISIAQGVMRTC